VVAGPARLGCHGISGSNSEKLGGEPNRVAVCCYLLSERILWGGHR
jgi:hypothetical protein